MGKKQKNPPDAGDTGDEGRFSSCPEQTVKAERGGSIQLSQADSVIESRVILGMQPRIQSVQSCLTSHMEPMQGKLASSQIDFGYTEQFCIPGVTSVFFSSCDCVGGDSLDFNQAHRVSLRV